MPVDINSPLGRMNLAKQNTPPPRILTIPDESEETAEQEQVEEPVLQKSKLKQQEPLPQSEYENYQAKRKEVIKAKNKISPGAKERIEVLSGLGRCFDEVEIEGITFSIRSLKSGELREVTQFVLSCANNADASFETKYQILCRSIYKIDDTPVHLIFGEDYLQSLYSMVADMDDKVVNYLFKRYNSMVNKNESKFTIKDETDAKEVAEDIKK